MKCRKCEQKLTETTLNIGDPFGGFGGPKYMYCENSKCEWFGVVVVAGIPDAKLSPKQEGGKE